MYIYFRHHSYKKRKDTLEGSLDLVLFAAELKFPKILVPRLPQNISNVNVPESQNNCIAYVTSFLEHWYVLILLFWY